jgi:hypothetical protein
VHDAGGVNVVDKAIVVVGCLGREGVDVLATVSAACRPRILLCAMVYGRWRIVSTSMLTVCRLAQLTYKIEVFYRDSKDGEIAWKSSQTIKWGDGHSLFAGKLPSDMFMYAERRIHFSPLILISGTTGVI